MIIDVEPLLPLPDAHEHLSGPTVNLTELAYALSELAGSSHQPIVVVTNDAQSAYRLQTECQFFTAHKNWPVSIFPDWETLAYDVFSPNQDIIATRLRLLHHLPTWDAGILIVPISSCLQKLPPTDFLAHHVLMLNTGDRLDINSFRLRLDAASYQHVSQVHEVGDYSVRGAIVDLFPAGLPNPIRLELFDDEIESIRYFDALTQRTTEKTDKIELLPAREFPMTTESISIFRQHYRELFEGDASKSGLYQSVSDGKTPGGIEYYFPLFFETTSGLTDYLPKNAIVVQCAEVIESGEHFLQQVASRYEARRYDLQRPILAPERLFNTTAEWQHSLSNLAVVQLSSKVKDIPKQFAELPDISLQYKAEAPAESLQKLINRAKKSPNSKIAFIAESDGRREVLIETLQRFEIQPKTVDGFLSLQHQPHQETEDNIFITVGGLSNGLWLKSSTTADEVLLITEGQLHTEWTPQARRQSQSSRHPDTIIQDLTQLRIGDAVVHEQQGIGRYGGLIFMDVGGQANEYALIEYAEESKLYVPVTSLHLLSRYTGGGDNPPLHKLGSEQWSRARKRALQKASDAAAELLDVYARRKRSAGNQMILDQESYVSFANGFAFQETPDQAAAIANVIKDMCSDEPMDRLVCGDVGFGKTEVAMRAAFVAVMAGFQVVVLSPTTLLTHQHTQNFMDRFADWPIRIEELSRFKTAKEQQEIQNKLESGEIDILIGTHKVLNQNIQYKNLGLIIIDEEHRFGVRQKEKLKSWRADIDILTLTATPIPRTLNLALSGLRELSIIATPPLGRLPIQTFVTVWQPALIEEAIQRELNRGGQVYFLHNEVRTMELMTEKLKEIVPEAKIMSAHGQMNERELEHVMLEFYHQRCNVLICSTIVESGIDVPTANTIIMNRADKLGLAQLHQLRGRVGRSNHRAYAYLLTPEHKAMTPDAVKRLEAIESIDDLGAGYLLANHDMEIRGAGEILGDDQSGQIAEVGFSMYIEMLEQAIKAIERGDTPALEEPLDMSIEVDLGLPALIPASYLGDINARLTLYKRIGFCREKSELHELQIEMIDRFGLLPDETKTLFLVTELKILAKTYGILKITANDKGARILFNKTPKIDPGKLILLIQSEHQRYQLDGQDVIKIKMPLPQVETRVMAIDKLLQKIAVDEE